MSADNGSTTCDALVESSVAGLTRAAYEVALRRGAGGRWLDLELELWRVLDQAVRRRARPAPRGGWARGPEAWEDGFLADLADAAHTTALRHGVRGPAPELRRDLYRAFRSLLGGMQPPAPAEASRLAECGGQQPPTGGGPGDVDLLPGWPAAGTEGGGMHPVHEAFVLNPACGSAGDLFALLDRLGARERHAMLRPVYRLALGGADEGPVESVYAGFKRWFREAVRRANPALLTFAVVGQVLTWLHLLADADRVGRWLAAVGAREAEARRRCADGEITPEHLEGLLAWLGRRTEEFRADAVHYRELYRTFCERVVAHLPGRCTCPPEGDGGRAPPTPPAGA